MIGGGALRNWFSSAESKARSVAAAIKIAASRAWLGLKRRALGLCRKYILNIEDVTFLVDSVILALLFQWILQLTAYFLNLFFGDIAASNIANAQQTLNLYSKLLLGSLPVTVLVAVVLGASFRRYRGLAVVEYARLAAIRRWQRWSWGLFVVYFLGLAVTGLAQFGKLPSTDASIAYDYLVGSLFPFVDWMILLFVAFLVQRPNRVYGNLAYLHVLSVFYTEERLLSPKRIRIILLGTYRIVSQAIRVNTPGLYAFHMDDFFTRLQIYATSGNQNQRIQVSMFAQRLAQILIQPDPARRTLGRVVELIGQTDQSLPAIDESSVLHSAKITWPGRFRRSLPPSATIVGLAINLIIALIIAIVKVFL